MKRRILIFFSAIAAIAMIGSGTLAYFTLEGTATNVITAGGLDFELLETDKDGVAVSTEGIEIMPGDTISEVVQAKNTGNHPMYLRVEVGKEVNDETLTAEDCISMDINQDDWTEAEGYYYYKNALNPGETTSPLFTEVYIDGRKVDNAYLGKIFYLKVTTYAVQSENNGKDVWSAIGWQED